MYIVLSGAALQSKFRLFQDQEASSYCSTATSHIPGGLSGGPGLWVQGQQDQGRGREHPPVRAGPH